MELKKIEFWVNAFGARPLIFHGSGNAFGVLGGLGGSVVGAEYGANGGCPKLREVRDAKFQTLW
jgi:hypothetical protein